MSATAYHEFIASKTQLADAGGFEPTWLPDFLFPFQRHLVDWAVRHGRAALLTDCGTGKAVMELVWAQNVHVQTGRPVLLLTPLAVGYQMVDEAAKFGVEAARSRNGKPAGPVTVTNYEQLEKFDPADFGGVVCDECFAAGTPVDTPTGQKYIETIRLGDKIVNAAGVDEVADVHRREVPYAVEVTVNGRTIVSSPNHPYFTRRGWIGAQDLEPGDSLVATAEAVRMVRQRVPKGIGEHATAEQVLRSVLFSEMADEPTGAQSEGAYAGSRGETRPSEVRMVRSGIAGSGSRAGAYPGSESDRGSRGSSEDLPHIESHEPRTFRAWGKWAWLDRSSAASAGCAWAELAGGVRHITGPTNTWLSDALQARLGESRVESRYRGGWKLASQPEVARCEEGRETRFARVDSVEVLESGDPRLDRVRDADGRLYFYDLGATRHPSFSVNGHLVHNSSCLKSYDSVTKGVVTEFLRRMPYRLLATATAAPNDYIELGTSSEALGHLGHVDMLNRFFINGQRTSDMKGGGRFGAKNREGWRFKGHSQDAFWRWVASWARAMRRPSDYGYDDGGFVLPPLEYRTHMVEARTPKPDTLFDVPASGLAEEREVNRRTLTERCEKAADMLADAETAVAWCHLNDESKLLARLIPGAVEVTGSEPAESKEEKLRAFSQGQIKALVTKPSLGAWGLNWQNCHRMTYFPSHSYEAMYQAVRRCWRFGQAHPVTVDIVITDGGAAVLENLMRKASQADVMFTELTTAMRFAESAPRPTCGDAAVELPDWLGAH